MYLALNLLEVVKQEFGYQQNFSVFLLTFQDILTNSGGLSP